MLQHLEYGSELFDCSPVTFMANLGFVNIVVSYLMDDVMNCLNCLVDKFNGIVSSHKYNYLIKLDLEAILLCQGDPMSRVTWPVACCYPCECLMKMCLL